MLGTESIDNNNNNKKKPYSCYDPIMKNVFDILKNMVVLGFNYYQVLKKLLKISIDYILSKKHLRKNFIIILLK